MFVKFDTPHDLIHLGIPSVDLNDPMFSAFDTPRTRPYPITAGNQRSDNAVLVLLAAGSPRVTVAGTIVKVIPNDLLIIKPGTDFEIIAYGSDMSAMEIPLRYEPNATSATYLGTNCRLVCSEYQIQFDSVLHKKLAVGKLYEAPALIPIIPVLSFQQYLNTPILSFPDRKYSRFVCSVLIALNRKYKEIIDELIKSSESQLMHTMMNMPMSETENIADVIRWMKTGYKDEMLDRVYGTVKLF